MKLKAFTGEPPQMAKVIMIKRQPNLWKRLVLYMTNLYVKIITINLNGRKGKANGNILEGIIGKHES